MSAIISPGPYLFGQAIIHVPADRPTIQAGIDAANNGDTVLVAPGTYSENIDFQGKSITVTSGAKTYSDADKTIIQAPANGPAVILQSGETSATVLNGFTITHASPSQGVVTAGDGIDVLNASPSLTNNIISNNFGCSIDAWNASALLIEGNHITGQITAKVLDPCGTSAFSDLAREQIVIEVQNSGNVQVIGNLVENNGPSGITVITTSNILIQNNIVRFNNASGNFIGSGIGADPLQSLQIIQNLVYGNMEGGIGIRGLKPTAPNQPPPTFTLVNNTIYENQSSYSTEDTYYGAQQVNIEFLFGPSVIANNLFIGDGPSPSQVIFCDPSTAAVTSPISLYNNDIYDAYPGNPAQSFVCSSTGTNTGNISVDPQFVSTATNDFHTQPASPVVGAGDINAPDIPPADLDSKARTVCNTIDMGVYEVRPHPPLTLQTSINPLAGGNSVTFTVTAKGNCNVPTGLITFLDGTTVIGTAPLNSSGVANFTTTLLFVGTHPISASYPGDFNFESSASNVISQVVTGALTTTSLSVAPNPAAAFQPITLNATVSAVAGSVAGTPTGSIAFLSGATVLANVPLNSSGMATTTISTLGAGTYSVTAVYSASTNYAASTSPVVVEKVLGANTATSLTATPTSLIFGQTLTLTATVNVTQGSGAASGLVTFLDGTQSFGTATLNAQGIATFATASLPVGIHSITASYPGSPNTNPSASLPVTVSVSPSDFTLTLGNSSLRAQIAQHATTTVLIATIGAFNDTIVFDCPNLPAYVTCTFTPATTTLTSAGNATVALTIGTGTPGHNAANRTGTSPITVALFLSPMGLIAFSRRRIPLRTLLLLLAILPIALPLSGCGTVTIPYVPAHATPPGTYTVPITATGINTHITHTTQLTLVVTP